MKKVFLSLIFTFITVLCYGQVPRMGHMNIINFDKYEVIDSLPIERMVIHFYKEIDDSNLIDIGNGDYMAPVPHNDKMIIRMTADRKQAVVVYNSYVFGLHFEFNVEDSNRRMVLWFKDKNIYCGYIYDKKYKVAKYFESKKEYNRFMRRPFFNRN